MKIPFDNNTGEFYKLDIITADIENGDGIVLTLNSKACESFSKLFSDLAKEENCAHIHLGYSDSEPQGPGLRIVLLNDAG
ncbi:MAG: hypothetical protein EOO53_16100 [Gammaproteobacteria bacterium]|nr:MAG: hypothetical protein EOO53_16100 [Gammaproteobacteria bacterium]